MGEPSGPGAGRGSAVADMISVTGLRVFGRHGVHAAETRDGQDFVIDLTVYADLSRAGDTDELADTVDYGALAGRAADIVAGPPYRLIEALAARIAGELLAAEPLTAVTVTVHKPAAPLEHTVADVAVTVTREAAAAPSPQPGPHTGSRFGSTAAPGA